MIHRISVTIILLWLAAVGYAQQPSARHDFLNVAAGRLYYEECGSGSAVILLHDGLLHSVTWDDVWPSLCARYHVVRYDRRGLGRSPAATAPFSPEDDLLRLLEGVHVDRTLLVGSSSGSAVALDFALGHPERVNGLVLIGPVVHGMRSSDWFNQRGNDANAPLATANVRAAAENWAQDPFQVRGARPEARRKILETLVASPQNLSGSGAFETRPSPPTVARLSAIQAPTLLVVGEGDVADVHAFSGAIQAALPVVRREVWKGDGHLVQLEDPVALVKRIEDFVAVVERKTIVVSAGTLTSYEGRYLLGSAPATVAVANGRLVLQLNGDADVPLFAAATSDFFVRTTGTNIHFDKDASGHTVAMIITNPGGTPVRCPRM